MAKDVPSWYHGSLTADEATKILTKFRRPGAYLLRDSQNAEGAFTLSCTVQESGNFVDVKHYRIVKVRLKKTGKKKFPTFKDIQKCLEKQAQESNELPPWLKTPIEPSMIDEWDQTDSTWRENYKVHEAENNSQQKEVLANPKDPKKQSRKFPRFGFSKKKHPNRLNNNETELPTSVVDSNRESGMNDYGTTEETNPSFTTNIKGQKTLDQNIGFEKDEDGVNSSTAKQPTTTNATDAKSDDEVESGSNDNQTRDVPGGIYLSPQAIITQNTGLDQQVDSNSITPTTPDSSNNADTGSVGNDDQQENTGIYMSTQDMGTKKNAVSGSCSQATEFTEGNFVPMTGKTFGNESRSNEGGGNNAANQLLGKNSGIYMAPQQNANRDNPVPGSEEVGAEHNNETQ